MPWIPIDLIDATRCTATHEGSGARVATDISPEYGGRGEGFSSTDLLTVALATCIGSSISPMALREGIALDQIQIRGRKTLQEKPKRVSHLEVQIALPDHLTDTQRTKLGHAARSCTVHRTLAPAIEISIELV